MAHKAIFYFLAAMASTPAKHAMSNSESHASYAVTLLVRNVLVISSWTDKENARSVTWWNHVLIVRKKADALSVRKAFGWIPVLRKMEKKLNHIAGNAQSPWNIVASAAAILLAQNAQRNILNYMEMENAVAPVETTSKSIRRQICVNVQPGIICPWKAASAARKSSGIANSAPPQLRKPKSS